MMCVCVCARVCACVWCKCLQILDRGGASALPRCHSKLWTQGRQSDRICRRHPKRNTGVFLIFPLFFFSWTQGRESDRICRRHPKRNTNFSFECDVCVCVCMYVCANVFICMCVSSPSSAHITRIVYMHIYCMPMCIYYVIHSMDIVLTCLHCATQLHLP